MGLIFCSPSAPRPSSPYVFGAPGTLARFLCLKVDTNRLVSYFLAGRGFASSGRPNVFAF